MLAYILQKTQIVIMNHRDFFKNSIKKALSPGFRVLDIGAGLRVDGSRGNVVDPARDWIKPLLEKLVYQVMDPVNTYGPDIVGDLMNAPMVADSSYDSVICLAVLEHVPRAWDAASELWRILKPGGVLVGYVPFLSPYHAMPGYYGDYVRFTDDGVRALFSKFSSVEVCGVRGACETIVHLLPSKAKLKCVVRLAQWMDRRRPGSGKQVSGFFFFCIK